MNGHAGRPRRLSPNTTKINLSQRQRDALQEMRAATGIPAAELIRVALEAYLVTNGFLQPISTNEGVRR